MTVPHSGEVEVPGSSGVCVWRGRGGEVENEDHWCSLLSLSLALNFCFQVFPCIGAAQVCSKCVSGALRKWKRASDSLELERQIAVGGHVGARNRNQVCIKRCECS